MKHMRLHTSIDSDWALRNEGEGGGDGTDLAEVTERGEGEVVRMVSANGGGDRNGVAIHENERVLHDSVGP